MPSSTPSRSCWTFTLAWRVFLTRGFDVIHACNPPDLFFLIGGFFKLLGKKFVFDHHDLNPELYEAKFGRRDFFYRLLLQARVLDVSHRRRVDRDQRVLPADRDRARPHAARARVRRAQRAEPRAHAHPAARRAAQARPALPGRLRRA